MSTIRKRLLGGEILELPIGNRFGYVQFLGEHREYGDAILVNPKLHDRQAHFPKGFFSGAYVTFYAANAAVSGKVAEVVAQSTPPAVPKRFRRASVTLDDGTVDKWVIEGGWRDVVRETLSEEERGLPIAEICSLQILGRHITSGWTPANDPR